MSRILCQICFCLAVHVSARPLGNLVVTFHDCGGSSADATVTDVSPHTIATGATTTLTGTGTLKKDVAGGTYTMTMTGVGGMKLLDCSGDASQAKECDIKAPLIGKVGSLAYKPVTFPIKAGTISGIPQVGTTLNSGLPGSLESTTTTLTVTGTDGDIVICVKIMTKASSLGDDDDYEAAFRNFVERFGKSYASEVERNIRFGIFKENYIFINMENAKGENTYELGVNHFTDLAQDEFVTQSFGFRPSRETMALTTMGVHNYTGETLAASVDWRNSGAVTAVKNQGQCGSCWTFSTTGALEGAWKIASGKLVSLSEEEFVQCDTGGNGCGGGSMQQAFGWAEAQSICTESSYTYTSGGGTRGTCHKSGCTVGIAQGGVTGYKAVERSEQALMSALNQQPVSIAVEADKAVFQSYRSGVMSEMCGTQLDHGILAIGYGTEDGTDYWLVKNSWGTVWGLQGYGKLLRGKGGGGECGILQQTSYPVVSASISMV